MRASLGVARRLATYLDQIATSLGHADRHRPCRNYISGLLLPGERKSMEPIASRVAPRRVSAEHQSLQHFVSESRWAEGRLMEAVRSYALPKLQSCGGITVWAVDDTGMPKKGTFSVGVSRQYCGVLGKQENCQVAVSVSVANEMASLPVAWRLYLPESWAKDHARRKQSRVPEAVVFQRKWEIALAEIDAAVAQGIPRAPIVADAGYGQITAFRDGLAERNLTYVVGILAEQGVKTATHRTARSARAIAHALPRSAWQEITWREGTRGPQQSRFAAMRVRTTNKRDGRGQPPEEWLLIEWPAHESEPTKYALSSLPDSTALRDLVRIYKLRWRIERDYQEMKDELGLDHFEGRSWGGFHHHGALCIAAFAFIAAERIRGFFPSSGALLPAPRLPAGYRPRGSPRRNRSRT